MIENKNLEIINLNKNENLNNTLINNKENSEKNFSYYQNKYNITSKRKHERIFTDIKNYAFASNMISSFNIICLIALPKIYKIRRIIPYSLIFISVYISRYTRNKYIQSKYNIINNDLFLKNLLNFKFIKFNEFIYGFIDSL